MNVGDRVVILNRRSFGGATLNPGHRGTIRCFTGGTVWVYWDGPGKTDYSVSRIFVRLMRPLELLAECAE